MDQKWIKRDIMSIQPVLLIIFSVPGWPLHFPVVGQSHCEVLKIKSELKQNFIFYNSKLKEKNRLYENATKALDKP